MFLRLVLLCFIVEVLDVLLGELLRWFMVIDELLGVLELVLGRCNWLLIELFLFFWYLLLKFEEREKK